MEIEPKELSHESIMRVFNRKILLNLILPKIVVFFFQDYSLYFPSSGKMTYSDISLMKMSCVSKAWGRGGCVLLREEK